MSPPMAAQRGQPPSVCFWSGTDDGFVDVLATSAVAVRPRWPVGSTSSIWGFLLVFHSNHNLKMHRFCVGGLGPTDRRTDRQTDRRIAALLNALPIHMGGSIITIGYLTRSNANTPFGSTSSRPIILHVSMIQSHFIDKFVVQSRNFWASLTCEWQFQKLVYLDTIRSSSIIT